MQELAEAIRDARGTMTKTQFAAEMGVTRQTVRAWENGTCVPAHGTAVKLMQKFGVPRGLFVTALLQLEAMRRAS